MRSETTQGLEKLRTDVLEGRLNRRSVLKRAAALGLSAPIIASLLAACGDDGEDADVEDAAPTTGAGGVTQGTEVTGDATSVIETEAEATTDIDPTVGPDETQETTESSPEARGEAGGGGLLRLLWWQAPTILNPHLAQGTKDFDASQIALEPLANFDSNGELVPFLATAIPSLADGGVAEDGRSVTWKLREGVTWHDGEPFTAEDVRFTWEFVTDEATTATTKAVYDVIDSVEIIDDHTVKLNFREPNPAWYDTFVGPNGMVLPAHIYREYMGEAARNAPANLQPIGTGPFVVREFRPADTVFYDRYENYWDQGLPYFDEVEMKGGGDAAAAARAVLETDEADWAWNIQVEPAILNQMAQAGNGKVLSNPGASAERVMVNFANPNEEVDGAFSEPETEHPIFRHKEARNAIALSIQRDVIAEQLYGAGGVATANVLNVPPAYVSPNTSWEFDLEQAQELVSGIPEVQGYRLLFQTSINSVRQKTQEIIKQAVEQLGFQMELKSVDSAVFFSSDAGNPDNYPHFYADLEMYTNGPSSPYPIAWAERYRSDQIAQQENKWSLANITRYQNEEFDVLHNEAKTALEPERQAELFIAMNDMVVNDFVEIPIVHRASVACAVNTLAGYDPAAFMSDIWDIKNWYEE